MCLRPSRFKISSKNGDVSFLSVRSTFDRLEVLSDAEGVLYFTTLREVDPLGFPCEKTDALSLSREAAVPAGNGLLVIVLEVWASVPSFFI